MARLVLLSTVLTLAGFASLLVLWPPAFGYILMEDSPVEWMGFYLMVAAAALFLARARRVRPLAGLCMVAAGLFCLFVAGEEISWGQRLLGYGTPQPFVWRNVQREVSLHNIPKVPFRQIACAVSAGLGVAALVGGALRRRGYPVPPPAAAPAFLVAAFLFTLPITQTDDEVAELLFDLGCVSTAAASHGVATQLLGRLLLMVPLLATLSSWASYQSPRERDHTVLVGPLKVGRAYEALHRWREAAQAFERLASYWRSDWDLWAKVASLYARAGDWSNVYRLTSDLITIHRREPRFYALLLEAADSLGIRDDALERIRGECALVLQQEPSTPHDWKDREFVLSLAEQLGLGR